MSVISKIAVELRLNNKGFTTGTSAARNEIDKLDKKLGVLRRSLGKVAEVAGGFLAANVIQGGLQRLTGFVTGAIGLASDLAESISKTNAVFEGNADAILEWSKSSASALGLSRGAALEYTATIGNLLKGVGVATDELPEMSKAILQTAADLGSFNNVDPGQVVEDLRSGLVGSAEPLRKYGILLTEAAVAQKAVELGLAATTSEVSEAAKVQARYALIMEQVGDAQGDFAKTSGGLANGMRILRAHFANFQAWLGGKLTPTLATVTKHVNRLFTHIQKLTGQGVSPLEAILRAVRYRLIKAFGPETGGKLVTILDRVVRGVRAFWTGLLLLVEGLKAAFRFSGFILRHWSTLEPIVVGLVASLLLFGKVIPLLKTLPLLIKAIQVAVMGFNPWILLIAAAVALLYLAWTKNWFGIRDKAKAVIDFLIPIVMKVVEVLRLLGDYWSDVATNKIQPGNLEKLPRWLRPIALVIGRVIKSIRIFVKAWQDKGFLAALMTIPTQLRAFGRAVARLLTQITGLRSVGQLVRTQFTLIADTIGRVISLVDNVIHGRWKQALEDFGAILRNVLQFTINNVRGLLNILVEIFRKINWSAVGSALLSGAMMAFDFLTTTGVPYALEKGKALIGAILSGLQAAWEEVLWPWLQTLPQLIFDGLAAYYDLLWSVGNYLFDGLGKGLAFAWDWLIGWVKDLPARIVAFFNGFYNWFYGVGTYLIGAVAAGISWAWGLVVNELWAAYNRLPSWMRDLIGAGAGALGAAAGATAGASALAMAGAGAVGSIGGATVSGARAVGGGGMVQPVSIETVVVNNPVNGDAVVGEVLRAVRRTQAGQL